MVGGIEPSYAKPPLRHIVLANRVWLTPFFSFSGIPVKKNILIDYETQGITANMVVLNKAPNLFADHIALEALGKQIGTIDEYFDGTNGVGEASYGTRRHVVLTSAEIDDENINDDFYGLFDWKTLFANVEIKQKTRLGPEEVLIVVATPAKGTRVAYWISRKSFLVLRKDVPSFPRTLTIMLGSG
jgi:hypothetical protein